MEKLAVAVPKAGIAVSHVFDLIFLYLNIFVFKDIGDESLITVMEYGLYIYY